MSTGSSPTAATAAAATRAAAAQAAAARAARAADQAAQPIAVTRTPVRTSRPGRAINLARTSQTAP